MNATVPCKRPQVTIDLVGDDRRQATCHVPRCTWTYSNVVKTDVEEQARRHRHAHKSAVPNTFITTPATAGPEYDVYCEPCGGHRRTFGTRKEAQAWLDDHLTTEHGLVVCEEPTS